MLAPADMFVAFSDSDKDLLLIEEEEMWESELTNLFEYKEDIERGLKSATIATYKSAINSFVKALEMTEIVYFSQPQHKQTSLFRSWANDYCHPSKMRCGGSQVGKTLAAIISRHDFAGVKSWARQDFVRKMVKGFMKDHGSLQSVLNKKIHSHIPLSVVNGLIESARADDKLWLAAVYHLLFYGLPRVHHFHYILLCDVVIIEDNLREEVEIYLGGFKTENSVAAGSFITVPKARSVMSDLIKKRKSEGAQPWDDVFPEFLPTFVNNFAKSFAEVNNYTLLDKLTAHSFRGAGARYMRSQGDSRCEIEVKGLWGRKSSALGVAYLARMEPMAQRDADAAAEHFDKLTSMKRKFKGQTSVASVTVVQMQALLEDIRGMDQDMYHYVRKCMVLQEFKDRYPHLYGMVNCCSVHSRVAVKATKIVKSVAPSAISVPLACSTKAFAAAMKFSQPPIPSPSTPRVDVCVGEPKPSVAPFVSALANFMKRGSTGPQPPQAATIVGDVVFGSSIFDELSDEAVVGIECLPAKSSRPDNGPEGMSVATGSSSRRLNNVCPKCGITVCAPKLCGGCDRKFHFVCLTSDECNDCSLSK
jgi:hypothetical protein